MFFRCATLTLFTSVCFGLGGCDKIKLVDEVKTELEATKQQLSMMQAEIHVLRIRLDAAEATLNKPAKPVPDPGALPAVEVEKLKNTIALCVDYSKKNAPVGETFEKFDAFYNPANGHIENNVLYNGQRPALYAFNKCMTKLGFSLR